MLDSLSRVKLKGKVNIYMQMARLIEVNLRMDFDMEKGFGDDLKTQLLTLMKVNSEMILRMDLEFLSGLQVTFIKAIFKVMKETGMGL